MNIRTKIRQTPMIGSAALFFYRLLCKPNTFVSSEKYWKERYIKNGTSGPGSYHQLAGFKAKTLNEFVLENDVETVIEFGCGDGNQLKLSNYPKYVGYDISQKAIDKCTVIFTSDITKEFKLVEHYSGEKADLVLSLDVIFHLIEDEVFEIYMKRIFDASNKYVIIYSSNYEESSQPSAPHVKHRKFTAWVEENRKNWRVIDIIPNEYPFNGNDAVSSFSDFYIFKNNDLNILS